MIGNKSIAVKRTFPIGHLRDLGTAHGFRFIATIALAVSGAVHLSIAPGQASHAIAHGMFFSMVGVAQLAWAAAFWRAPSMRAAATAVPLLAWTGIALSPFEVKPHPVDGPLIATKASELLAFMGLMVYLGQLQQFNAVKTFVSRIFATSLVLGTLVGFSAWGTAHVAELIFPELGHVEKHNSSLDDGSHDDDRDE